MHLIGIVWSIIIFLFIGGLFMGEPILSNSIGFWNVVLYSFLATAIIITIINLKNTTSDKGNKDLTPEEIEKKKEIKEWSRRNNC